MRQLLGIAVICSALSFPLAIGGDVLFGLHNDHDADTTVFYTIDPSTGDLTEINPSASYPIFSKIQDMAMVDGVLWIARSEGNSGPGPAYLMAINANTGEQLCPETTMTWNSNNIYVESLTVTDGQFYVGFGNVVGSPYSYYLGVVDPDTGIISDVSDYRFCLSHPEREFDFDGLATNNNSQMFSTDVILDSAHPDWYFDIYRGCGWVHEYWESGDDLGCGDLTFVSSGEIYCPDTRDPYQMFRIDEDTYSVIETFSFDYQVIGIAAAGPPGTLLIVDFQKVDDDTFLTWSMSAGFSDVVRGDLTALRASNGDFELATEECLENDLAATELLISGSPDPGGGYWYLVRSQPCGSYGCSFPTQRQERDSEIELSDFACE